MNLICNQCGCINEYRTEKKLNNLCAYCKVCDSFIKNIPYSEPKLYFGKYKNVAIKEFTTSQHLNYLHWLKQSEIWFKLSRNVKDAINKQIG